MSELKAMKAVYCYPFPEIANPIRDVDSVWTREMSMVTTPSDYVHDKLEPFFNPPLEIPATDEGYFKPDDLHIPIIKRFVDANIPLAPALKDFEHSYPAPGSSEGIFKLLTRLKVDGVNKIYVLEGEYEGYKEYAGEKDLRMEVEEVKSYEDIDKLEPGHWFISNPSARNGKIIPNKFINELCDAGHKVIVDLAYMGSTEPYKFDVSHENIPAVVVSLSKPYGFFRYRVGYAFTHDELHSMIGNMWFKDPERLVQGQKLVEDLGPDKRGNTKLYKKYRPVQLEIINEINDEFGLNMTASDALLLGRISGTDAESLEDSQLEMISKFKRGPGYRFCLTPYFEQKEREGV